MAWCVWCDVNEATFPPRGQKHFCEECLAVVRPFICDGDEFLPMREWPDWMRGEFRIANAAREKKRWRNEVVADWLDEVEIY